MQDEFTITPIVADKLIRVVIRGHWTVETVGRYKTALIAVLRSMSAAGCRPDELVALVDARDLGAQSQNAVALFQSELGGNAFAPCRLATLVTSALFRRQVERITAANQRLFTDEAEALAWLMEP